MAVTVRKTVLRCTLYGRELTGVLSARGQSGYDVRVASCEINLREKPAWADLWQIVEVYAGGAEATAALRFRGAVAQISADLYPNAWTLVCRGTLILAELYQNPTVDGTSLAGMTDQAQVEAVLSACGVPSYSIEGTGQTLGSVAPDSFVWDEGQSGLSYIQQLDEISCVTGPSGQYLGYRTFDSPWGQPVRRPISAAPTEATFATLTEGVDVERASARADVLPLRNKVIANGYNDVTFTVQSANPYVRPVGGYNTHEFTSPMIESSAGGPGISCQAVALFLHQELNRIQEKITVTTPRDDGFVPGQSISIVSPSRLGRTVTYFCQNVAWSYDDSGAFSHDLTLLGGVGYTQPEEVAPNPPIAGFTITVEVETVLVAGTPTQMYFVSCDGGSSMGMAGTITGWSWSAPGGDPDTGSGRFFTTTYTDITGAEITLTVTDSTGQTDDITIAVEDYAPTEQHLTRPIFLAAGTHAEAFDGTGWATDAPSGGTVNVVANGPVWGSGTLALASADSLATSASETTPFSGGATVTAAFIEADVDPSRVLLGSSDGKIAVSVNGGTSWTVKNGATNTAVLRVLYGRSNPALEIHVLYAALYAQSMDGGSTWFTVKAAGGGQTFRDLCLSHTRNVIALSGSPFLMVAETGAGFTFPVSVTDVVAVTAHIRLDGFYCYDATGKTFYCTSGTSLTQGADLPSTSAGNVKARGLWRDGAMADFLYIANGAQGAYKSADGFKTTGGYYPIRTPGVDGSSASAHYYQVGTDGRLVILPPETGNVYVGTSQGLAKRSVTGTWSKIGTGTLSGNIEFLASPKGHPDTVYVACGGGLFHSTDAGASWTTRTMPAALSNLRGLQCRDGQALELYTSVNSSAGSAGVYKSTDGGASWTRISQNNGGAALGAFNGPLDVKDWSVVSMVQFYQVGAGELFSSVGVSGGATGPYYTKEITSARTIKHGRGAGFRWVYAMTAAGSGYAGYAIDTGVGTSEGVKPHKMTTGPGTIGTTINCTVDDASPMTRFLLLRTDGSTGSSIVQGTVVARNHDGGTPRLYFAEVNWNVVASGLNATSSSSWHERLAQDPADSTKWWCPLKNDRVYKSADNGQTWTYEDFGAAVFGTTTLTVFACIVTG